jgi:hypothetical protein
MSGFRIKDKDDAYISINDIDAIAAKFWGVEVSKQKYACPKQAQTNWFDMIGYAIANPGYYTTGWRNVICTFQSTLMDGVVCGPDGIIFDMESTIDLAKSAIEYSWPYVELVQHFIELGFVPVKE